MHPGIRRTHDSRSLQNPTAVALVGCADYSDEQIEQSILRIFEILGGIDSFVQRGDRVLLKPNLIVPAGIQKPAQTHPAVIIATAKILKDFGSSPIVGDSPAWGTVNACLNALGIEQQLKRMGIEIVQLNQPVWTRIAGSRIGISRAALEADKIINLPKFKAHQQLGATFAIKNIFGCVAGKEKPFRHYTHGGDKDRFCRMLIEIYQHLGPALNLIDGVMAMEGQGPISGKARPLGVLVAGVDPIACERVCCRIVNFNPKDLPILTTAENMHFGVSLNDSIMTVGDPVESLVCKDFQSAKQSALRFGLLRIIKSITKQAVILIRGIFSGKERSARL